MQGLIALLWQFVSIYPMGPLVILATFNLLVMFLNPGRVSAWSQTGEWVAICIALIVFVVQGRSYQKEQRAIRATFERARRLAGFTVLPINSQNGHLSH